MSKLSVLEFQEQQIRTIEIDGEIAFSLSDALKSINSTVPVTTAEKTILEGIGDEFIISKPIIDALNREQIMTFVFEAGLTFLVSRSRTELGKKFNRWLHTEILPSIRKTGKYEINKPKTALELAKENLKLAEEQVKLLEQIEIQDEIIESLEADNNYLAEVVDELFDYSSIIRIAKFNNCSEKLFNWRILKATSVKMNIEIKKVPDPRFESKNLYAHNVWRVAYPKVKLPETTTLLIQT